MGAFKQAVIKQHESKRHLIELDRAFVNGLAAKAVPLRVVSSAVGHELDGFVATRTVHDGARVERVLRLILVHEPMSAAQQALAQECLVDLHLMMPKA